MTFRAFKDWGELLAYFETHNTVFYKAPLDVVPRRVWLVRVFKNGKVRLDPLSLDADRFTADGGHLARFRALETP